MTLRRLHIVSIICVFLVAVALLGPAATSASGTANFADQSPPSLTNATLTGAYPNPVARGDPGEFVSVRFPSPTNTTGWTLTDGKRTVELPNRTLQGEYAFSTTPTHASEHTELPVVELEGPFYLADDGETLELYAVERKVDSATYRRAPESRIRDFRDDTWVPVGATQFDPVRTGGGPATAFVLPDAPDVVPEALDSTTHRIYLAGYTFTSERLTGALLAAADRNVSVRVLLDGSPVGGMSERQARLLDRLSRAGVDVRLLDGPASRYTHHHAKYAVVDERVLVTTENFKPAGTGGMSSRGWGVVLEDAELAEELAEVYRRDFTWDAAIPWPKFRAGREFQRPDPALGHFETQHPPRRLDVSSAMILVAPDNAGGGVVEILDGATDRILIQQVRIDSRDNRLLAATMAAADRGVSVRIHLSDAWYVEDENRALVAWLEREAEINGWDLDAAVDEAAGYSKIHTKGVIVDDRVILGSLNWGDAAMDDNREVAVVLEGADVTAYYRNVFETDRMSKGDHPSLSRSLVGVLGVVVSAGLLVARRIEFVGRDGALTDWKP